MLTTTTLLLLWCESSAIRIVYLYIHTRCSVPSTTTAVEYRVLIDTSSMYMKSISTYLFSETNTYATKYHRTTKEEEVYSISVNPWNSLIMGSEGQLTTHYHNHCLWWWPPASEERCTWHTAWLLYIHAGTF